MQTTPTTQISSISANTIILGAGAAAMNCAVQLVEAWRQKGIADGHQRVVVVTGGLSLGASRMSGSDKQTYYKMGTSPRVADTADDFAKSLTAFGCCDGDTALVEGIGSLRGFYNLVDAGVPFPHDPCGAFVGYKTDHDPYERATSAGPKTSKFMAQCLEAKARRLGVQIIDKHVVAKFLTQGEGDARRIVAALCVDRARVGEANKGLVLLAANNWVLAGGGPGEIYRDTVYPQGQYGFHAAAFEAGLEACNLTESQYGLASIKFRWNVSGTYMQVVPRIFSTDAQGNDPREFLADYFESMPAMATAIFLKGYQWPFDAQRITNHQSSLIDMAVHQETVVLGRRVWMDFLSNPVASGFEAFDIAALHAEAREYLQKTGALQARPIDRLAHMNGPAIDIYTENEIDLWREPLEIAICAQHNNGGFAVNKWWESSIRQTFVIGEMAGTHGVKRPGGSALNAGQIGALRAAQCIANVYSPEAPDINAVQRDLADSLSEALSQVESLSQQTRTAGDDIASAMTELRQRMTRCGAHLRDLTSARDALAQALAQYRRLRSEGLRFDSPAQLPDALIALQQCLTHVAMLKAVVELLARGSGSRGSHCVLDDAGVQMHPKLVDPQTNKPYRFKPENESLRSSILRLRYDADAPDLFVACDVQPRPVPLHEKAFEVAWSEFRDGKVFEA